MDLEILESLALLDDRSAAIAQLLPGSEDHDYYRALAAQHAGSLDDADLILNAWPQRHGHTERYERLRQRQLLCRLAVAPDLVADQVRDQYGVDHAHEAEGEEVDPTRPTRIGEGWYTPQRFLEQAVAYSSNLSQVTDEGLYELIDTPLDATRRRVLLGRLRHTPEKAIVMLVADDLAHGGVDFGGLSIHNQLTLDQLTQLAGIQRQLRAHATWVGAVVQRLRPPSWIDLELDREARAAYLETLWQFVAELPPAINSLKAHVLWHVLDTTRRLGREVAPELFRVYLRLPRSARYVERRWLERVKNDEVAQLGADYRGITGLPPAGDDEALVRELLHARIDLAEHYAEWLDRAWLEQEIATARLLQGQGDADRATLTLGPSLAAALREQVELAWCIHNPTRFGLDEPISLEVDVKNVAELTLKVFRIDPLAYFQHQKKEVGPELDLDGLAASHEQVLRLDAPAIRRIRRRIELPMCARAGTYVVDLIGNGISSRAVIAKGRLRHVARIGAAGHVVTIVDEGGRPRSDARAWLGDREYVPDQHGAFAVPFSTSPGATSMLLSCGDIATVARIELVAETYVLSLQLMLDRQSLTAGRTAKAIARVGLDVAGMPASLQLLKRTTWDVTLTDRAGVATTKSQPLVLSDDASAVLEWPMGEDVAGVAIAVRGTVDVISQQREQELVEARAIEVASMAATHAVETTYLAETDAGNVISALGKTGEPRAQRPVTIGIVHRWSRIEMTWELATDATGRVELGSTPGATQIAATLGDAKQIWSLYDGEVSGRYHAPSGRDVIIPLPPSRTGADLIRRASLVEIRAGVPAHRAQATLEPIASGVIVRGLAPGDYALRGPGLGAIAILIAPPGAELASALVTAGEVIETPRPAPAIASVTTTGDLVVAITGAGPRTRVHAISTRFAPALVEAIPIGQTRAPHRRLDRARAATYVSGRELGDEYRYILERKHAKRFPSLLLDKPSLLLNPWSRRTTKTDVQSARAGGAFGAAPAPMQSPGYGGPGGGGAGVSGGDLAYAGYDFLAEPPAVLANLEVVDGVVTIARAALGRATSLTLVLDDPAGTATRRLALAETPLDPRDRRLELALDPARHARQAKQIAPLVAGDRLVIEDLATAKLHLLDSIERAHGYLLALRDDATLREFAFVARWHALADHERRELYSKYACHELHLFAYCKDRPFFDAVIRPSLANKRVKTFLDHYLLAADLAPYLEPERLAQLNAVELALLAQRLTAEDTLPRLLADLVALLPPDPDTDTRIIDALIDASALDGDEQIATAKEEAYEEAKLSRRMMVGSAAGGMMAPPAMAPGPASPPRSRAPAKAKKMGARAEASDAMISSLDEMDGDYEMRREAAPMFRAADKTQEWAENNWWHRSPTESGTAMIAINRLWRDLAAHRGGTFLSRWLGLATHSFAEAMCALALVDLPFVPAAHAITAVGPRLEIVAAGNALAGTSQLVDGELVASGPPLVVGQNYVRHDDRHDFVDGEQIDKYVTGPLATGVVYTCQIVLANPTSTRQRIAALVQIPRGSLPVGGAKATTTIDVALAPYGTHGHEYSFYVPFAGACTHFPVHVSRGEAIVAAAPGTTLAVSGGGGAPDHRSWPYLSQHGELGDVVVFLANANVAAIDLEKVAWRMRDRAAYDAILAALERRRAYHPALWGYALYHRDPTRITRWVRMLGDRLLAAGPVIDAFGVDAEQLGRYEHLELAPLINARAHRLGPKVGILNDGLAAQYRRFLDLVAHRRAPTAEDLLAAAHYLLAQDRHELALATLSRVGLDAIADRMQHDYLAAFAACLVGDVARARALAAPWREMPVDRWRARFGALLALLDELTGAAPAISDAKSRDQQHAELAAKQPAFELALDRDGALIRSQHVAALELRYFEMDVELLFSRQPFVQSDVSRFSFIEPGHREQLANLTPEHRVAWPARLRGKNVVVEAVGAGQRKAKVHYANDLAINLAHQYGQIRVQRASDQTAIPSTYVKTYARKRGGAIAFYKDGYTDLRGWFDYASLSTTELDDVERFAILVCSDHAGSAILEANPPAR